MTIHSLIECSGIFFQGLEIECLDFSGCSVLHRLMPSTFFVGLSQYVIPNMVNNINITHLF